MLRYWHSASGLPRLGLRPEALTGATVSVNGDVKHTSAGSTADSGAVGDHNVAVAVNGSQATANDGTGNKAIAVNNSRARAINGNDNMALAVNGSNQALAGGGNNNTAKAINGSGPTHRLGATTAQPL